MLIKFKEHTDLFLFASTFENSKVYGDLLVRIQVDLPQNLTKEEKELFKKLASLRSTANI